jgi:cytochrome c oxidase cbb3-type subunit 3
VRWILACACVLVLWACRHRPTSTDGKVLFEDTCARCHGKDGHGDPVIKQQLPVPDMTDPAWQKAHTDADIVRTVHQGSKSGKMPPFGDTYSDQQLAAIIQYVRHFAPTPE